MPINWTLPIIGPQTVPVLHFKFKLEMELHIYLVISLPKQKKIHKNKIHGIATL